MNELAKTVVPAITNEMLQEAKAGNVNAIIEIAKYYEDGNAGSEKKALAYNLYANALRVDEKCVDALLGLAYCFEYGIGTSVNELKSNICYEKAAELGSVFACITYAQKLEEKNLDCTKWYEMAFNLGEKTAALKLADICRKSGKPNEMIDWLKEAVKCGNDDAMRIMGNEMLSGRNIARNFETGIKLLKKSAECGNEAAKYRLDEIERVLTCDTAPRRRKTADPADNNQSGDFVGDVKRTFNKISGKIKETIDNAGEEDGFINKAKTFAVDSVNTVKEKLNETDTVDYQRSTDETSEYYNNPNSPKFKLPTGRGALKVILLSIITFGIYGIILYGRMARELNTTADGDGKHTLNYYLLFFLIGPFTLGIGTIIWYHEFSSRIGEQLRMRGIDYKFGAGTFWGWEVFGVLILIGPFVYLHKVTKAVDYINDDYNRRGKLV